MSVSNEIDMAKKKLVEELRAAVASHPKNSTRQLIRAETHCPDLNPLTWLAAQNTDAKLFWSDREQAFAVAGIGIAAERYSPTPTDLEKLFDEILGDLSRAHPNLRYYGGFRFDGDSPQSGPWESFGAYRFTVPAIELGRKGNRYYLACNLAIDESIDPTSAAERLESAIRGVVFPEEELGCATPEPITRDDTPSEAEWKESVNDALDRFGTGPLEKVVLARESSFTFDQRIDPLSLLNGLTQSTPYSYHFCFQTGPDHAFIGASPERLYKRTSTYLQSEALAGTRPRGATPSEDSAIGQELLQNDKELREHRLVAETILKTFASRCRVIRGGDCIELLVLRHCQHLLTRIEGMLDKIGSDADLLAAFHPTPAVGGLPRDKAIEAIKELEPFERGWYAGPVGWVGYDSSEFAVAIRSGLLANDALSVYTGAGIVPGSVDSDEWDEIENKMTDFLAVLDHSGLSNRV